MKLAQQLLTLSANYIKLPGEKWCVRPSSIPKSCHPRCCALHQRWLRWSWGCPAPNAGTAAQCVGLVNSWKDEKVSLVFLGNFSQVPAFTYLTLVFSTWEEIRRVCACKSHKKEAKTAKTRKNDRLGAKLQKNVKLRCMSVSLALCWWQFYPATRKDTTTNLL